MGEMICLRDIHDFKIFSGSETGGLLVIRVLSGVLSATS